MAPVAASAAETSYLCAITEVYECLELGGCKRAALQDINLASFIIVDVDNKQLSEISGGKTGRTEDIEGVTTTDKAVFLYGTQDEETWSAAVIRETGALTGGITSGTSSFSVFGTCTPKP